MSKNPTEVRDLVRQAFGGRIVLDSDGTEGGEQIAQQALRKLREVDPELAARYEQEKNERRRRPRQGPTLVAPVTMSAFDLMRT